MFMMEKRSQLIIVVVVVAIFIGLYFYSSSVQFSPLSRDSVLRSGIGSNVESVAKKDVSRKPVAALEDPCRACGGDFGGSCPSGHACQNGCCVEIPTPAFCGNGIKEAGEECDGNGPRPVSCQDWGYPYGNVVCADDCTIDFSDCYYDKEIVKVISGYEYSCALDNTGDVYCWGDNSNNQLGVNKTTYPMREDPIMLDATNIGVINFKEIWNSIDYQGNQYVWDVRGCGVDDLQERYCWGDLESESDLPHEYNQIDGGKNAHACGITDSGEAYCWGWNNNGQLGDGNTGDYFVSIDNPVVVSGNHRFVKVSAGSYHTCGLTEGGEVYCWGKNDKGQLGTASQLSTNVPNKINTSLIADSHFIDVSVGRNHACAIGESGDVYCWGWNTKGILGDGTQTDRNVPVSVNNTYISNENFTEVYVGPMISCGLTTLGEAYCWGADYFGELGNNQSYSSYCGSTGGTQPGFCSKVPVPVDQSNLGGARFDSLSPGKEMFICGLTEGGDVYCWGRDNMGQVGDGAAAVNQCPRPWYPIIMENCAKIPVKVDFPF
jgi:alpha-tubulin suppressor-like RCC1 family protein